MSFLDFPGLQYFYNKYLKPIKPHAREETIKSYTVNEQGHVPDAQLVAQLKEENESLQEKVEALNSALEVEAFNNVNELITYAENLLATDTGLVVKSFSIGDNSPSSFQFGYSIGLVLKRYDTVAIYIFAYNGSIFSNGKTKNSDWIGWGRFDPVR